MRKWRSIIFFCLLTAVLAVGCRKEMSAEEYLDLGKKYLLEQKYEEAIVAFTKVIEIDEKAIEAYQGLAEAYVWNQDYEKAVETLKQGYARTEDASVLAMQEGYEKYLEYPETFQDLARLLEDSEKGRDPFLLWEYMGGKKIQALISGLPVALPYGNGAQGDDGKKPFLLYPCGHCYYGNLTMGERSGDAMWVSFDYEEGFADFYQGQWEQDYPNGEGSYLVRDLWESEEEYSYSGTFKNGIFEKTDSNMMLEGVLHAMKDVDDDRIWESRVMSEEDFREYGEEEFDEYEENSRAGSRNEEERTTGRIRLVSDKIEGGIISFYVPDNDNYYFQYNPEKHYFLASMEWGKGVGLRNAILDIEGNVITSGYEEQLWMVDEGYVKIKYCYAGTEDEMNVTDMMAVVMEGLEGCAYAELYDWSGKLIKSTKLGDDWRYWGIEAEDIYPPKEFEYDNINIQCEPNGNELIVYDLDGVEIGRIMTENADELIIHVIGNLLELLRGGSDERGEYATGCEGIYWIEEERE